MSTRSRIGYVMKAGVISSVYCHSDGYLLGVGKTLLEHYTDPKKIQALIKLGDLSSLDDELAPSPGVKHSFDEKASGVTCAYGRDRGEKNTAATKSATVDEFLAIDSGQEYSYLWDDGKWWVWEDDKMTELTAALVKERLES